MSPEDLERKSQQSYDQLMRQTSSLAFYDAVGDYWSDDIALTEQLKDGKKSLPPMKHHVDGGAATALSAIASEHLGYNVDTFNLIQNSNSELASALIAHEMTSKFTKEEYSGILNQVRDFNVKNQHATEQIALRRHGDLSKQLAEIQRQAGSGELIDEVKRKTLELQVHTEQTKNLGTALGSLQASATLYDQMEKFGRAKDDVVEINVGSGSEDAEDLISRLALRKGYNVDMSDPDNIKVRVSLSSLSGKMGREKINTDKRDKFEKLKTSMEGVEEDEAGNTIVPGYEVPGFKSKFVDESGATRDYAWRVEQRNDIEWLNEATMPTKDNPDGNGGGLITRTVGAGKTNTALGFFGNKLAENPDYRGLVVVPKGRANQWLEEAERFTDLPIEIIPEGISASAVEEQLLRARDSGVIFITGHREAARAHETLGAMQDTPLKIHGITIDEPQELQARGQSGNIGAMGKRLMKVPFDHRVGLTATPARRNAVEAFDLAKWSSGAKELGSRARFQRTFGGFGSGTNAQDQAVGDAFFRQLQPYVSGDRLSHPTFTTTHTPIAVGRSNAQIERQKQIEAGANIEGRAKEIRAEAQRNPSHPLRRRKDWDSPQVQNRASRDMARAQVTADHDKNLGNGPWQENSKLQSLANNLGAASDKKHVIFLDSQTQRQSVTQMLLDSGMPRNAVKNIASTTTSISAQEMAARVKDFKSNPKVNIMLIDKNSSSGYNLQKGDELHVIGTPQDAATYLQAQGRIARAPREGDVTISTYRYSDAPEEASKWIDLDTQMKVLRASAPGMFSNL